MKIRIPALIAAALAMAWGAYASAAPISITVPSGGSGSASLQNLTFGTNYGFSFIFENVTGSGQLQLTANIVDGNACCGPSISPDIFNFAPNVLHTVSVATPTRSGYLGSLSFVVNTYGSTRAGTVRIQDVTVNGQVVGAAATAVPEPSTLALLGLGLLGLSGTAALRRRSRSVPAPLAG